jgi:photosystem II stability/assembly factor-like uncharacterized protein
MKPPIRSLLILPCVGLWLCAQDQPPAEAARIAPLPPPALENTGKPMVLPFQCTAEDIQWAGLSCSEEEPCPVYLELTAAASAGDKFFAVGNIHSAAVTLFSVTLASEDAGRTWRETHPRLRGAGLDFLQFVDSAHGWAAGQQLFPLPQDPFVLSTTDGGKTWRQQPIFNDAVESRSGSITQFYFSSATAGALVVDLGLGSDAGRYASYESADGGETWSIKEESSKPLHLKAGPAAAAEWRVRADGPSQSFHLEHRASGDRWVSRAAFAVKLGACKPPR